MKEFLVRLGYTASWAFGIPNPISAENTDSFYAFGLILFIAGAVACVALLGIGTSCLIYKIRKDKKYDTKKIQRKARSQD